MWLLSMMVLVESFCSTVHTALALAPWNNNGKSKNNNNTDNNGDNTKDSDNNNK